MRLPTVLAVLVLATSMSAPALAADNGTITISGHGEVTGAPDTAFITSGVTSQGNTAAEALGANTAAMTELLAALKEAGIEERDIQTSNFSVNPNYVYTDERDANGYSKPPKIQGYIVTNTVNVRVRQLSSLGAVLDRAVAVGANTINGISFTLADPKALYNEARKAAFADAEEKAKLYAGVAQVDIDSIRSISESQSYGQPQPIPMAAMEKLASAPVPVQGGELTFAIDVQVTWDLDD